MVNNKSGKISILEKEFEYQMNSVGIKLKEGDSDAYVYLKKIGTEYKAVYVCKGGRTYESNKYLKRFTPFVSEFFRKIGGLQDE